MTIDDEVVENFGMISFVLFVVVRGGRIGVTLSSC